MWFLASAGVHYFQTHRQKGKFATAVYHLFDLKLNQKKKIVADVQISMNFIKKTALGSHVIANPESLRFSFLLILVKLLKIHPQ